MFDNILHERLPVVTVGYVSMNDSFECHGVCTNECEIPANYFDFSDHFFLALFAFKLAFSDC